MSHVRARARRSILSTRTLVDVRQLLLVVVMLLVLSPSVASFGADDEQRPQPALVEVPGLRSASSETFARPDGSFVTEVYAHSIRFRDGDAWKRIEATFTPSRRDGFAFASGANAFSVDLKAGLSSDDRSKGGFLRFSNADATFALSLEGAETSEAEQRSENTLRYTGALKDVDLEYQLLADGVKETLVLGSAAAPTAYRFVLSPETKGLRPEVADNGSVAFYRDDRGGRPVFVLAAPVVSETPVLKVPTQPTAPGSSAPVAPPSASSSAADTDAASPPEAPENPLDPTSNPLTPTPTPEPPTTDPVAGAPTAATPGPTDFELVKGAPGSEAVANEVAKVSVETLADGTFALDLTLDAAWLKDPKREFPVHVDPTILSSADVLNAYFNTGLPSSPAVINSELWAGTGGGATYASAVKFDLGAIPPGARVAAGKLSLWWWGCYPSGVDVNDINGCSYWQGNFPVFEARRLTQGWTAATTWSGIQKDSTLLASYSWCFKFNCQWPPGGWMPLESTSLRSTLQSMVSGATPNHGFLIENSGTTGIPGTGGVTRLASNQWSDPLYAPKLEIEWTADAAQLAEPQHLHANGAELVWTRYDNGLGPYGTAVLADAPIAYWRLDDGLSSPFGTADWSGNAQHLLGTPGARMQPGATTDGDTSYYFDGSSHIETAAPGPQAGITDTFTIEALVKRGSFGTRQAIFSRGESNGGGFRLFFDADNYLKLSYGDCEGCFSFGWFARSSAQVTDGGWHHVAATKSGGTVRLYLDGQDVTVVPGAVPTLTNGLGVVVVGSTTGTCYSGCSGRWYADYFNGWIDEPAVWSSALTQTQIAAHNAAKAASVATLSRFEVHRSTTPGFTPSASTLIATLNDTAVRSYRDTTARSSTEFYYRVLTVTSAGTFPSGEVKVMMPAPGTAQLTIQPGNAGGVGRATSISSASPCQNQGASGGLSLTPTDRVLTWFDLRAVPSGVTVTSATLSLFTFSAPSVQATLYRVTSDWAEGSETGGCAGTGATWSNRQPNLGWAAAGGDLDSTSATSPSNTTGGIPHWDTWNVQPIVQGWLSNANANLGFLIRHLTESGAASIAYASNDYTTSLALRPKLVVVYEDGSAALGARVAIGSPAPGGLVKGNVSVTAGASDDGRVAQVQFRLDGANLGAADTTDPYSVSWDTTTASRGQHVLTAVATDDAGNQTTSAATKVTVANSAAPTVSVATSGGAPATTDDFDRADSSSLGAGWSSAGMDPSATCFLRVVGNQAASPSGSTDWCDRYHLGTAQADGVVFVRIAAPQGTNGHEISVRGRTTDAGTSAFDTYQATYYERGGSNDEYRLWKAVNGSWTQLAATTTGPSLQAGDLLGLRYVGTAVSLWRKPSAGSWTQLLSVTDGSVTGSGKAGVQMRGPNGRVDDFTVAGDFTSGSGTITATATASDDVGVSRVEFLVDGDLFGTDGSSPYSVGLDTLAFGVFDGSHVITARAYDGDGNVTVSGGSSVVVANAAGTMYRASFSGGSLPAEMVYDAAAGGGQVLFGSVGNVVVDGSGADRKSVSRYVSTATGTVAGGRLYLAGVGVSSVTLTALDGDDGSGFRGASVYAGLAGAPYVADDNAVLAVSRTSAWQYFLDNAFVRFDTSVIPDGATVTGARLKLGLVSSLDADGLSLVGDYYDFGGEPSVAGDWTAGEQADAFSRSVGSLSVGVNSFELANLGGVSRTGWTGIRLKASQRPGDAAPSGLNEVLFAASEHASLAAPQLEVTYTTSQDLRMLVYADEAGAPGTLLASSSARSFASDLAPGWQSFVFPAPAAVSAGTEYWVGLQWGPNAVVNAYRDSVASGAMGLERWNVDAFGDGAASPFGSHTQSTAQRSLELTVTTAAGGGQVSFGSVGNVVVDGSGADRKSVSRYVASGSGLVGSGRLFLGGSGASSSVTLTAQDGDDGTGFKGASVYANLAGAGYSVDDGAVLAGTRTLAWQYFLDNAFVRFDTSVIPDGATVTSAQLKLYVTGVANADGLSLVGDYYDFGGEPSVAGDWTAGQQADAFSMPIAGLTVGAVNTIELGGLGGVSRTGWTGVRLKASQRPGDVAPSGFNDVLFAASEHATLPAPQLVVTYTVPQELRMLVYANNGGAPGALLASSSARSFASDLAPGWQTFTFPTPAAVSAGSEYWIGLQWGPGNAINAYKDSVASGTTGLERWNADAFADGATTPFGSHSQAGAQRSLEVTVTTAGGAGQASAPLTVGLTNVSSLSWPTVSTKLRYRWIAADGTTSSSGDVSIGATDLAAGGNRNVAVTVDPPTLPAGVYRARYRLRIDLYDTVAARYFAAMGNQPFEQWLTVTRLVPDALGLERYQAYEGEELGGGVDNAVNLANGNNVVQWVPFNQPGIGLSTVATITYNSLEAGSVSPLGNGWSLALSSLSPLGTRLDVHPNAADTAAGRTQRWIGLVDADGSYHRLVESATANVYTAPAGLHLYVRDTQAAGNQRYKLVKPDRTVFWYGDLGYPTSVVDEDGNALTFTLTSVAAGDDAYGASKQITAVSDQGGRSFQLAYYTRAETGFPAVRGKLKTITDHAGHRLRLDYYTDGNLLRLTEEGGTNADGSYLPDRSLVATYTNVAGTAPAITAPANRVNPDPTTTQGRLLYSLSDFRGNETTFTYTTGKLSGRTNRAGNSTSYAYNTPTAAKTTVTLPLQRVWVYTLDPAGRVTSIQDPLNPAPTSISWDADNMPASVTEPTGVHTDYTYNANGYLTSKTVTSTDPTPKTLQTTLTYQNLTADSSDPGTHLSRVTSVTQPAGNATPSTTDYTWTFAYIDNTEDHVATITDPLGNVTTNTWYPNGTPATTIQPTTGDGHTRTTTYNTYDTNGLPTQITDAAGNITHASYHANGNLSALVEPINAGISDLAAADRFFYDSYGRLGTSSRPRSYTYRPGASISTITTYDANDNVLAQGNPFFNTSGGAGSPFPAAADEREANPATLSGTRTSAGIATGPIRGEPSQTLTLTGDGYLTTTLTASTADLASFTLEAWVKRPGNPGALELILGIPNSAQLFLQPSGTVGSSYFTGSAWINASSTATITDGNWHHVVATRSGTTLGIYVDGALSGSQTSASAPVGNSSPLGIGGWSASPASLSGSLAEVAFYKTALTAARVSAHASQATIQNGAYATTVLGDNPAGYWRLNEPATIGTGARYDAMDRPIETTSARVDSQGPIRSRAEYDAAGRVATTMAPRGVRTYAAGLGSAWGRDFVTETAYDLLDRVTSTTRYVVDGSGAVDVAKTRTTRYCYDLAGDLRSVTGPKANNPTPITCPAITTGAYSPTAAGSTGRFEYDFAHRQTRTSDPLGNYTKTSYDENGAPLTFVDWVAAGSSAATEAARTTAYAYNDRGERVQQLSPFDGSTRKLTTQWTYDALGNVSKVISPRAYDTGTASLRQTNAYDGLNRLVRVTLPSDGSTPQAYLHYGYDANGNQTMVSLATAKSDPGTLMSNERTAVSYWDTGAIYSSTDPANPTVWFDYTAEGWQSLRVPEQVGQAGRLDLARSMYWDYLPDGLLRTVRDIGGQRASYAYDANGNRTQVNEASGITQSGQAALNLVSTFSGFDELKSVVGPKFGVAGCTQTSSFAYDLHGNLASLAENAESGGTGCGAIARTFAYGYDSADRLSDQIDDFRTPGTSTDDEQYTFAYTAAGWLDTRVVNKRPSGSWAQEQKSARTYFDNGQLKTLANYGTGMAALEQHQLSYTTGTGAGVYLNGNKAQDVFTTTNADAASTCSSASCTASWAYDARDRLTNETPGTGGSTSFVLDVIGNVTSETTGGTTTARSYTGQQLASVTVGSNTNRYLYDPDGNVDCVVDGSWQAASCPLAGSPVLLADNVYDYANRLTASRAYNGAGALTDSADYVIDPLDRPVRETETHVVADAVRGTEAGTTTTTFAYLGVSDAVTTETAVTPSATKTRTYAYDGLGQRATLTENGSRYSYLYDPHGSVSLLLDQANGVKASYGYSAYGSPNTALTKTAAGFVATTNPYRYTAKRYDPGSNTLDMGARRYSAAAGRFLQYDQYWGALDNLGLSLDPLNANRYLFAGANPINNIEIDGHSALPGGCLDCEAASDATYESIGAIALQEGNDINVASSEDWLIARETFLLFDRNSGDQCTTVPDAGWGLDFSPICEVHDVCYGNWLAYRSVCDDAFSRGLHEYCYWAGWNNPMRGAICEQYANAYAAGVRIYGESSWEKKAYRYDSSGLSGCPFRRKARGTERTTQLDRSRCLDFVRSRSYRWPDVSSI